MPCVPVSFSSEPASGRQIVGILAATVVMAAGSVAGFLDRGEVLAQAPVAAPMFLSLIFVTGCLSAYLLRTQFRLTGLPSLAILSTAYLFSGVLSLATLLALPESAGGADWLGVAPDSALWLWIFWHGGFAALVLLFSAVHWGGDRKVVDREAADRWNGALTLLTLGAVALLVLLATLGRAALPGIPLDARGSPVLPLWPLGGPLVGLTALALAAALTATRSSTLGNLALCLSLVANFLSVALFGAGAPRFSPGWYAAWFDGLISSASVLMVFMHELTWLYLRLNDLNATLQRLTFLDELTGLANRRQFAQRLEAEWARAVRERRPIGLIMLDIDYFKQFNDRYGHPAGDACLRRIARTVAAAIRRPTDLAARYGGEEFVVILPDTDEEGALHVARAIGEAVRRLGMRHESSEPFGVVTVSQGVAVRHPDVGDSPEHLLFAADQALYAAKTAGRNQLKMAA